MSDESKILFCEAKNFFRGYPFEVIKIGGSSFVQRLHSHDYIQIWYVKNGSCIHCLRDVEYKLTAGDIFILPPNIPHRIISANDDKIELIGLGFLENFIACRGDKDYVFLENLIADVNEVKAAFSLNGSAFMQMDGIFNEILIEYKRKEKYFELYIKSNLLKILSILTREYYRDAYYNNEAMLKYKDTIVKIIDYMKENYQKKIYIQEVSDIANMSVVYFSQVFKYITGRTFTEYLRYIKIEKAKEMILDNSERKTIGEIAMELGFDDHGYFDRLFKKEVGISPKKYKNLSMFF